MADNVQLSAGTADGAIIATDQDASAPNAHYQLHKLAFGALNTFTLVSGAAGLPVALVAELPAGTQNIGDVDVASSALPTGASTSAKQDTQITAEQAIQTAAELLDNIVRAEDEASAGGHSGAVILARRTDTPANQSGTDGDYEFLQVSAGRLWVDASGKTLTVDGSGVTQPVSHAALTELAAAIDTEMQCDIVGALPAGANAIGKLAANSGVDIGDVDVTSISAGTNNIGNVGLIGRTTGGLSIFKSIDLDESEEEVKATAGQIFSIVAFNRTAAPLYLKLYNLTAANTTVGTSTPVATFVVPANADSDGAGFIWNNEIGLAFSTAISAAVTTAVADNDTGAPGANDCVVMIGYV